MMEGLLDGSFLMCFDLWWFRYAVGKDAKVMDEFARFGFSGGMR